jgi:hypothetical protein
MTWNSHDEEEQQPGIFTSWQEFLKAAIVFAICSGIWTGLILAGTRLWHK